MCCLDTSVDPVDLNEYCSFQNHVEKCVCLWKNPWFWRFSKKKDKMTSMLWKCALVSPYYCTASSFTFNSLVQKIFSTFGRLNLAEPAGFWPSDRKFRIFLPNRHERWIALKLCTFKTPRELFVPCTSCLIAIWKISKMWNHDGFFLDQTHFSTWFWNEPYMGANMGEFNKNTSIFGKLREFP